MRRNKRVVGSRENSPKVYLYHEFKKIKLNLNETNLWVSEKEKSDLVIDSIMRGIEEGCEFPYQDVEVVKVDDANYFLKLEGHHRALGHYIANKPLNCVLIGNEVEIPVEYIPIGSVEIIDDEKSCVPYEERKRIRKNYL